MDIGNDKGYNGKGEGVMADDIEHDDGIIELTQLAEDNLLAEEDQEIIELVDIISPADQPGLTESVTESTLTREQLDAALERVIEKKFAGTIEKILFEVMEKVIEKEIADIRERLQKDLDDLGSV